MSLNTLTNKYEGYIYKLTNIQNGKVYIGQTTINISHRIGQHFAKGKAYCKLLHNAIMKYGKENFDVTELFNCNADSLEELKNILNAEERRYIALYDSCNKEKGYNLDLGGSSNNAVSLKIDAYDFNGKYIRTFNSISEAARYYNLNATTISDICYGKIYKSRKAKIVFRFNGDSFDLYDPFTTSRQHKVYKYNLDGNLLNIYNNYVDAANSLENFSSDTPANGIASAINSKRYITYGFFWNTKQEFYPECVMYYHNQKPVDQYDIHGNFIRSYKNISDAYKYLKLRDGHGSGISKQCNGETYNLIYGSVWRYYGDSFDKYPVAISHSVMVDKYDFNGNLLNTYNSCKDAAIQNNYDIQNGPTTISHCCNKTIQSAYGFVWRFHGESFERPKQNKRYKSINCYDMDGNYISTFSTAREAAKILFPDGNAKDIGTNIINCAKGKAKYSHGYKWYYETDSNQPDNSRVKKN